MASPLDTAISEIDRCKTECLALLADLENFCPADANGRYPDTFRLLALPMFYSAWERCFSLCHSIALRLIRDEVHAPHFLKPDERAIWLLNTGFFASLSARIKNELPADEKAIGRGQFAAVCEFLKNYDSWSGTRFDGAAKLDDLVMTFSNVNPSVVEVNATAIGMRQYPDFAKLRLGRLNDLVGRRNDIGHGAVVRPPDNQVFCDLRDFTRALIGEYSDMMANWLRTRFEREQGEALAASYMDL